MRDKLIFKVSPEIYPPEKERANKETVWEHYFARRIAFLLAPIFLKAKISANQISVLAIITGILAALLIMLGDIWMILFGAILFQVWLIFDKTDGIVARFTKTESSFGKFLEELEGAVIAALFFSSIGAAASKFPGFLPHFLELSPNLFVILGILASFFIIFRHLTFRHFETVFFEGKKIESESASRSGWLAKIIIKFSGVYSLAQPIFILAVIFNFLGLYIIFYFLIQFLIMLTNLAPLVLKASKS